MRLITNNTLFFSSYDVFVYHDIEAHTVSMIKYLITFGIKTFILLLCSGSARVGTF